MHELLTPDQMDLCDRLTITAGMARIQLMGNAGAAVADILQREFSHAQNILVLCGCGNNGGDGFVAARILVQSGLNVSVQIVGDVRRLHGDAALAYQNIGTDVAIINDINLKQTDLIVDAIFGAGLDRDVKGTVATLIDAVNSSGLPVVSIDLPSGIDGASGLIRGVAISADVTVTFFRKKPGHVLYPGRENCGNVVVRQIGIHEAALAQSGFTAILNRPENWLTDYPQYSPDGHKYHGGHTLVIGGPLAMSGATRLVARAALRAGSGLVTLTGAKDVMAANAAQLTSVMLREVHDADDLDEVLCDQRINCVVLGPGLPPNADTRNMVLKILSLHRRVVLDAGALTAFVDQSHELFAAIKKNAQPVVLTPHEGEFSTLFGEQEKTLSKIERARIVTEKSGATIVLKGPDTVVASAGGNACVSDNAPAWLATAGSGDVLAGVIAGLLARGMSVHEAASAAVWIHGDAAMRLGPPLVSSDLDRGLRHSIAALLAKPGKQVLSPGGL